MPLSLLLEWMAHARLNPFQADRQNWYAAMMAATFHNTMINLWAKHPRSHFKQVDHFLVKFRSDGKRQQTPKELYETFKNYLTLSGQLVDLRKHDNA